MTTASDWLARIRALPLPERVRIMTAAHVHDLDPARQRQLPDAFKPLAGGERHQRLTAFVMMVVSVPMCRRVHVFVVVRMVAMEFDRAVGDTRLLLRDLLLQPVEP